MGSYGGPLSTSKEISLRKLVEKLREITRKFYAVKIVFNGTPWIKFHDFVSPYRAKIHYGETMIIHPVPSDPLKVCTSSCRRNYKKAVRMGLELKIGTAEDITAYMKMYADTSNRQGTKPRYSSDFFRNLLNIEGAHLLIAHLKGQPLAGMWLLTGRGEVFYWHGVSYTQWLHLRPNNFLHVEAIKMAYEWDARWYNMGASLGIEGLKRFKASFGATPWEYPIIEISIMNILDKI